MAWIITCKSARSAPETLSYVFGISSEASPVEEAVKAYTFGSAYAEFQENAKGTVTVGKLADLVILSDDIFTMNANQIGKTKVLTTIVDGKIIYENLEK